MDQKESLEVSVDEMRKLLESRNKMIEDCLDSLDKYKDCLQASKDECELLRKQVAGLKRWNEELDERLAAKEREASAQQRRP